MKEDPVEEQRALATLGHTYLLKADTYTNPDSREKQDTLRKAKKYCLLSLQVCEKSVKHSGVVFKTQLNTLYPTLMRPGHGRVLRDMLKKLLINSKSTFVLV